MASLEGPRRPRASHSSVLSDGRFQKEGPNREALTSVGCHGKAGPHGAHQSVFRILTRWAVHDRVLKRLGKPACDRSRLIAAPRA
jgi:hypothetical protein